MRACALALLLAAATCPAPAPAAGNLPLPGFDLAGSDPQAVAVADQVMERLGGRPAWDATHYVTWRFFGRRLHVWDKWTGDLRFEEGDGVVLMNLHSRRGRAWEGGTEVTDPDTLARRLQRGYEAWINDSYWLVMPYKLKDSGVTLKYAGRDTTAAGTPAEVLELTFTGVGVTPQNRYRVWVTEADHLVRQWAYYADAADAEPRFVGPWDEWQPHGRIWLSAARGPRAHSDVAVYEALPRSVFESPEPVDLGALPGRQ
ncbi:MAG: hypothetical protein ABIL09_12705 [Gemmatimonadota bacterium]